MPASLSKALTLEKFIASSGKTHILFDFDETVATLHIDWQKFRDRVCNVLKLKDGALYSHYGSKTTSLVNALIEKYGVEFQDEVIGLYSRAESEFYSGYTLHPEIASIIPQLSHSAKLYIVSNNTHGTIVPILEELGLLQYFTGIVSRSEMHFTKPHGDPFRLIADGQTPLSKYLMVGDNMSDKLFAEAAGIDFFDVNVQRNRALNSYG